MYVVFPGFFFCRPLIQRATALAFPAPPPSLPAAPFVPQAAGRGLARNENSTEIECEPQRSEGSPVLVINYKAPGTARDSGQSGSALTAKGEGEGLCTWHMG
jgi:hypothetical protein